MTPPSPNHPRRARLVAALAMAMVAWLLAAPWTAAQELPTAAAAALREAERLAAEALSTYEQHFPDRRLWIEALSAGRAAAAAAPDHPAPHRFLAQAYGHVSWYARAFDAWQRYQEVGGTLDPTASQQLLEVATWLGARAFEAGWSDLARDYLETVVLLDPDQLGAHERLARLALDRGSPADAMPHLARLTDDGGANVTALRERAELQARHGPVAADLLLAGRAAQAAGDLGTAFDRFSDALAVNANFLDAWRGRAETATALGRPTDGFAAWERVLQLAPGDTAGVAGLARARDQLAFGVEAQRAFERGVAAYAAGNVAGARAQFVSAVAQSPAYVDALAWLGRLAAEAGDLDTAAARYRSARDLAPNRSDVTQALAQVEARLAAATQAAQAAAQTEAQAAAQAAARATAQAPAAPTPKPTPQAPQPAAVPAPEPTPLPQPEPRAPAAAPQPANPPLAPSGTASTAPWLTLVDTTIEHRAASRGGGGAFTFLDTGHHARRDLTNLAGGTLHARLDVRSKPTDQPIHYQLCLVQEHIAVPPACTTAARLEVRSAGSFMLEQPTNTLTGAAALDWRTGIVQLMLMLRQPDGVPIDDRLLPGQTTRSQVDPADYYPMEVRVVAILVAPGASFPGWP